MDTDNVITAFKHNSEAPANVKWAKVESAEVDYGRGRPVNVSQCVVEFTLPEDFTPPVLFYYRLSNFYQNHRRYVASFSNQQLKGEALSKDQVDESKCDPLRSPEEGEKPYYPCGLIANSIFNDTFSSPLLLGGDEPEEYSMSNNSGIAWESDKTLYGKTEYRNDEVVPPPNWQKLFGTEYSDEAPIPNLEEWEGFMVWMRTAGLPTFSKLYQRNDIDVMKKGTYRVVISNGMSCVTPLALPS